MLIKPTRNSVGIQEEGEGEGNDCDGDHCNARRICGWTFAAALVVASSLSLSYLKSLHFWDDFINTNPISPDAPIYGCRLVCYEWWAALLA